MPVVIQQLIDSYKHAVASHSSEKDTIRARLEFIRDSIDKELKEKNFFNVKPNRK